MDSRTETIRAHYSTADGLPNDNINHLYEDAKGVFWLASKGGGLIRWDRQKNTFRQFTRENGLSDNTIYAVYEDDYENLWLPSNYGLMRFDKNSQDTRAYLPQNGIAHEEFNTFAHFQAEDGTLYFGGLNGITQFHPKDVIGEQKENIPLYLAKVRVLTENAEEFLDKAEDFRAANVIRLDPGARILELEVSLLDYESSADNQYAYQIEGYQDQWVYISENKISIINPPYGRYVIKIKGRGAAGAWSNAILTVPVYVRKPFYLQWTFLVLLSTFIIATAIGAVRWRVAKLKRDRVRLESEVQKRTLTIRQQAEELKALDKAKTRFFSNITHEFRTPLTLIIGPLEQVVADTALPSIFRRRIGGILKNARHLLTLINQMLDLSKIEGGHMKTEAALGDIITYTGEIVSRFQALAKKKEQRLNFITPLDHWETHFDKEKWDKILYNLLSNAIKFTAAGQSIQASLMKIRKGRQDFIRLDVKDSGIGIEKEQLSQIFDRFYQADSSSTRAQGGTGIGLALVKELVELQGGEIRVSSEVGKGATFEVYLPVLGGEQPQPLVAAEPAPEPAILPMVEAETSVPAAPVSVFSDQPKLELLLIEDNAEMREYIRYCIDTSQYNITEAADGEEGIEKARALVPDLIISDVMMPKKNGFEVVKAIRGHIGTSHIPLILLTARASLESRLEGLRRGADAYLTKPFSPQELALRIEKLIELRRLLQQRYQNGPPAAGDETYQQEDEFISNLRTHILEHLDEPNLDGDHIGRHFGLSRSSLHRKLKALTDQSISELVRAIRLSTALELIRRANSTFLKLLTKRAFPPSALFARFQKAYGKAPTEMKYLIKYFQSIIATWEVNHLTQDTKCLRSVLYTGRP
ncbi:MAG: response regulator [Lewinellaceae bacterium]|nr:response regulator [Lewinellaceae bacterium]